MAEVTSGGERRGFKDRAVERMARAVAGDAKGMREHLERSLRLATEQGRPAARCELSRSSLVNGCLLLNLTKQV